MIELGEGVHQPYYPEEVVQRTYQVEDRVYLAMGAVEFGVEDLEGFVEVGFVELRPELMVVVHHLLVGEARHSAGSSKEHEVVQKVASRYSHLHSPLGRRGHSGRAT